jgi:hypothetical protein
MYAVVRIAGDARFDAGARFARAGVALAAGRAGIRSAGASCV